MIINESKQLNERAVNLGNGASAYSYGGKYYIKKGDSKKEISQNQYKTLLNGKTGSVSNQYSDSNKKSLKQKKAELLKLNDGGGADKVYELAMKYQPDAENFNALSDKNVQKIYKDLEDHYKEEVKNYGTDDIPSEVLKTFNLG